MADRNTKINGNQIKDATVTADELATSVAGDGLAGGGGSALSVNVDDSSIETNADTLRVKALGIDTAELAANAVTAAKMDLTDTFDFSSGVLRSGTPSGSTDVANKSYVDGIANGLDWKGSCRLATNQDSNWTTSASLAFSTGTLTITGLTAGSSRGLIDVIEPVDDDRILIKDAGAASAGAAADDKYNGLWKVTGGTTTSLTLVRTTDADEDAEVTSGLATFIEEGSVNADNGYVLTTNDPITVDTTAQVYTQFTGAGQITAGVGLTKSGNTIDLDLNSLSAATVDVSADFVAIEDATDNSTKKESIADVVTAIAGTGLADSSGVMSVDLNEVGAAVIDVTADEVVFIDATDSSTKKESVDDLVTALAGNGVQNTSSQLALDLNELTAAVVDVSADSIAIVDATDNSTKKEAIADVVTAVAGSGLAASSGVLAVDLNELSTEATFDPTADYVGIVDATDSGSDKSLWSVIAEAIAGSGITNTNGVLSADAVTDQISESDFVKSVQTASGSQTVMTTFSGSAAVVANSVQVYLNGLIQEEGGGNDYTINTSTGVVTFLVGLDAGDIVTLNGVLDN